jgi:serine/threonine protein kinase
MSPDHEWSRHLLERVECFGMIVSPDDAQFLTVDVNPQDVRFLAIGTMVRDRYRITRVLGSGGMGNVYQAMDTQFPGGGMQCAIKQTLTPVNNPPTKLQQVRIKGLREEYDIMSKLNHPCIPRVYDFFLWNGQHYLVMDYIEGETLNDMLLRQANTRGTGFDEEQVIEWALHICKLFDYLHKQQPPIIYRDCKPDNLIITSQNTMVLIDFGIARRKEYEAKHFTEFGTRGYAAPEAYNGRGDPRSDIYSLGALMFALLTGQDPRQLSPFEWEQHRPRRYRAGLSSTIDNIIIKCLKQHVAERWQSARELHDVLSAHLHALGQLRRPSSPADLPPPSTVSGPNKSHTLPPLPLLMQPDRLDIAETYAVAPDIIWTFEARDSIGSSPVVRDDLAYFGADDSHLYAIDLKTGQKAGSFRVGSRIFSDPIVTNSAVIVGGEDGKVYAIDRALKRKLWSYDSGKPIVSSPTAIVDLIIIGNDAGEVHALSLAGGRLAWTYQTHGAICGTLGTIGSLIVFGSHDHRIYALDARGTRRWWLNTRGKVDAAPVAVRDMLIIGGQDRMLYALDQESGTQIWRHPLDGCILTAVTISESRVYVGTSDGRITCLDVRNGEGKWSYNVRSQITTDLVEWQGRIYFGCADGGFYCMDLRQPRAVWRQQTRGAIVTRPAVWQDLVIVGSYDHTIYALRDPQQASGDADRV